MKMIEQKRNLEGEFTTMMTTENLTQFYFQLHLWAFRQNCVNVEPIEPIGTQISIYDMTKFRPNIFTSQHQTTWNIALNTGERTIILIPVPLCLQTVESSFQTIQTDRPFVLKSFHFKPNEYEQSINQIHKTSKQFIDKIKIKHSRPTDRCACLWL
jgi:hypothetical protein